MNRIIILTNLFLFLFTGIQCQDGLELYLPFDNHLNDESGNNYHGSSINTVNYIENGCKQAIRIRDNNSDAIFINGNVFDELQDFSISIMIKLDGLNSSNNLISCANYAQSNEFIVGYNSYPDSYSDAWHMIINKVRYRFGTNKTVNDLKWHHVLMVREGNEGRLYIDGRMIGDPIKVDPKVLDVATEGFVLGQDQDCMKGCFEYNQSWYGVIDELRVFSRAIDLNDYEYLSCLDCAGIPNGSSKIDTCGVCLNPMNPSFNQSCVIDYSIFIPSSFSPDRDGVNDLFRVFANDGVVKKIKRYEVYAQSAVLVHKEDDFDIKSKQEWWDGKYRGENLSPAVYIYNIEVEFINAVTKTYTGEITLLR